MALKNLDMIEMQIDALVEAGYYPSKFDITRNAFRVLLETRSDLKVASAVELYKMEKISLSRGAEIAGVSLEEFKEILADRGIVRKISPDPDIDDNVARILEERD
jgi:predicted HTH domain antitoxin